MNETTKKHLRYDPVAEAEKVIGRRHDEWHPILDGIPALSMIAKANEEKNEHLDAIGDTHFGISWKEFLEIAKQYGFEVGFHKSFTGLGWSDKSVEEEEVIYFHKKKGLILHAESFSGDSVNSAKVYGELHCDEKLSEDQWDALQGCSHGMTKSRTMHFDVDVREGFRFHLDAISNAFSFLQTWSEVPFLWFLNYMDTKDENYSYDKINREKLQACAPEVRQIISK